MNKDNQQVKDLFELGWISAIIDGEGWLIFNKQLLPSKNFRYVPVVGMNNTSLKIADNMENILKRWEIGLWRGKRNFINPNHKSQYVINVRGFKRVKKLLDIITPYLIDKKEQAEIMVEYIQYRESLPLKSACGEKEESFRQRIIELNK